MIASQNKNRKIMNDMNIDDTISWLEWFSMREIAFQKSIVVMQKEHYSKHLAHSHTSAINGGFYECKFNE